MIVPTPQGFSTIPIAGVFSDNSDNWYLKLDTSSGANLATGAIATAIPPGNQYMYWPGATLCFK